MTVNKHEDFQKVLKRFKRSCERAGIRKDLRRAEAYEKPSERRRREMRQRVRKLRNTERKRDQRLTRLRVKARRHA
ncbi:MAG: 30S ribosomal protein S21 [Planctomycetes bacterium]|nr:30S ribosomal protein S21 [Planctomycetota bacterium]